MQAPPILRNEPKPSRRPSPSPTLRRSPRTPPSRPRLSFGRLMAVLMLLTVGAVAWRSGAAGAVFASLRPGPRGSAPSAGSKASVGLRRTPAVGRTPSPGTASSPSADAEAAAVRRFTQLGLPIYCGGGAGNYVALTFDDGPAAYTPRTIEMLEAAGDTATFFIVGKQLEYWGTDAVKQEAALGEVGDHTWNHVDLTGLPPNEREVEIVRTRQTLGSITGRPVSLFRPPLADHDAALDGLVQSLGMLEVGWSVDSMDSAGVGPAQTLANVVEGLKPGAIILMHENRGATFADLPAILRAVSDAGLQTVTVPQLLALDPPSDKQVRDSAAARACVSAG
jgi:peptidoglycan/xylan/chitin deacetylase (PgdA/CDA1 family)